LMRRAKPPNSTNKGHIPDKWDQIKKAGYKLAHRDCTLAVNQLPQAYKAGSPSPWWLKTSLDMLKGDLKLKDEAAFNHYAGPIFNFFKLLLSIHQSK